MFSGHFSVALLITLLMTPWLARPAARFGYLDLPAPHKHHRTPTPYLGGLALAGGLIPAAWAASRASGRLTAIIVCALVLVLLGLRDDRRSVDPRIRLGIEAAAGLALWVAGTRAEIFQLYPLDLALTVLWVVGITNALNLLDNMDGLCAGVAAIAALALFALAYRDGDPATALLSVALAGACLGFLFHNLPPARIFLGDAGTLPIGFLLAGLALEAGTLGSGGSLAILVPVMILGAPILDTILVLVSRLREARPLFRGGTDHASHRLVRLGLSPREVALILYGAEATSCAGALWLAGASSGLALVLVTAWAVLSGVALVFLLSLPAQTDARPVAVKRRLRTPMTQVAQ